jgi:HTH-type transcriptional regulator / antitoxin HipB
MSYLLQTPNQLAVHLRALRLAKGWSQTQLAEKLGLSQSRIARIERDPLSISVDQMLRVLSALGASMCIQLDASRPDRMAMPTAQEAQAGRLVTKSEQGDW